MYTFVQHGVVTDTTVFQLTWILQENLDSLDVAGLLQGLTEMDSRYLIEKLYNMTMNQSYSAAQKELAVKEMEAKLNEVLWQHLTL